MIYLFGITIISMVVVILYRKYNNKYRETVFKYKLHELRDRLRILALKKKVNINSREYDYTDFAISKGIQDSYYFTLFYIFINKVKHELAKKDMEEYRNTFKEIDEKIQRNVYLKEINEEKNALIWDYLYHQNLITIGLFKKVFSLIFGINKIRAFIKQKVTTINILPETSGIRLAH